MLKKSTYIYIENASDSNRSTVQYINSWNTDKDVSRFKYRFWHVGCKRKL